MATGLGRSGGRWGSTKKPVGDPSLLWLSKTDYRKKGKPPHQREDERPLILIYKTSAIYRHISQFAVNNILGSNHRGWTSFCRLALFWQSKQKWIGGNDPSITKNQHSVALRQHDDETSHQHKRNRITISKSIVSQSRRSQQVPWVGKHRQELPRNQHFVTVTILCHCFNISFWKKKSYPCVTTSLCHLRSHVISAESLKAFCDQSLDHFPFLYRLFNAHWRLDTPNTRHSFHLFTRGML